MAHAKFKLKTRATVGREHLGMAIVVDMVRELANIYCVTHHHPIYIRHVSKLHSRETGE